MIVWWIPYLAKVPTPDFNNGPGNDFIVTYINKLDSALGQCTCTKHSSGVISLDMLTSLGQSTIRLRHH